MKEVTYVEIIRIKYHNYDVLKYKLVMLGETNIQNLQRNFLWMSNWKTYTYANSIQIDGLN